jgi:hypothetical protein
VPSPLKDSPGPVGRENMPLLRTSEDAFITQHLGDDVPERKILYESGARFCILAHHNRGAGESAPRTTAPRGPSTARPAADAMNDRSSAGHRGQAGQGAPCGLPAHAGMAPSTTRATSTLEAAARRMIASRAPTWRRCVACLRAGVIMDRPRRPQAGPPLTTWARSQGLRGQGHGDGDVDGLALPRAAREAEGPARLGVLRRRAGVEHRADE